MTESKFIKGSIFFPRVGAEFELFGREGGRERSHSDHSLITARDLSRKGASFQKDSVPTHCL
jgi:hypothetical protein